MNILIIDDDPDDTSLFCEAIGELFPKATCSISNTCRDIKKIIVKVQPDIIFMDGLMYPVGGKECLIELNSIVDRKRVKIIMHTASVSPTELNKFRELGIDDILIKANSYQGLMSNIRSIIVDKYNLT